MMARILCGVALCLLESGAIEGDDFADAFFAIWFGDDPPNPGLLGGPCG